jgi:hypothetical protein
MVQLPTVKLTVQITFSNKNWLDDQKMTQMVDALSTAIKQHAQPVKVSATWARSDE